MILKILTDADPILREKSLPIDKFDKDLEHLVYTLLETVKQHPLAVGLSAVQCGILKRVILVSNNGIDFMVLINPIITKRKGSQYSREGCLSLPDKVGVLTRPLKLDVTYQDLKGKKRTLKAEKFLACVVDHEIDHLNGVLMTDL